MASQFLNFLDNIDKGRRDLISSLNLRNFNLPADASLKTISNSIQELNYQTIYPKDEEWQD